MRIRATGWTFDTSRSLPPYAARVSPFVSLYRRHAKKRARSVRTPTTHANQLGSSSAICICALASCMLPSIMSLALAMAPMCSLAPRFSVFRPAALFVPTLATHGGMATGIHGYMECEPAEPEPDTSCHAGAQHMRHLSSKSYLETTCCGACPDRAAAVSAAANPPGPIEAVPRSTHNEVGASQLKTSRMRRVPVGRSTRGRTPLALLRPSHGPTSGRRLASCCMQAGDLELRPILPQLPERPPGARYLLSRSDAGTLIVTLPPRGIKAAISLDASTIDVWAYVPILYAICGLFMVWPSVSADFSGISLAPAVLVQQLLDIVDPYAPFVSEVAVNVIFGCAGASWLTAWLAARAFTTATLSVGEFQWEYKETIASVIPTCCRQGSVEELDICLQDKQFELITGIEKICIGGNSWLSEEESDWVFNSVKRQITAS